MSAAVRVTILYPEKTRETFAAPQTHGEVHLSEMIRFHHGIVKCLSSSWLNVRECRECVLCRAHDHLYCQHCSNHHHSHHLRLKTEIYPSTGLLPSMYPFCCFIPSSRHFLINIIFFIRNFAIASLSPTAIIERVESIGLRDHGSIRQVRLLRRLLSFCYSCACSAWGLLW